MGGKRKKHTPTYKPKNKPKDNPPQKPIEPSEPPLIVFISSLIDKMMSERDTVDRAIRSIPIIRPWRFERTPASSQPVEESYLSKVRECDLFIILLAHDYSEAVAREYQIAVESNKPVLAFIQNGERSPEQNELIKSLGIKYARYTNSDDLQQTVLVSVLDELVRRFRGSLKQSELHKLIDDLPVPARSLEEVLGYVLVGMEDDSLQSVFKLFDVFPPPENLEELYPSHKQVYFDNLAEMKEVFDAINNAMKKSRLVTGDRQKVYIRALKEESLKVASRYIVRQKTGKQLQVPETGVDYFIWAVAPDIARIMTLMRPDQLRNGSTPAHRTKNEFLFKDANYLLAVFKAIVESSDEAGDDMDEYFSLLLLAAARLRFPELEDDDDSKEE
jgi:hypothetical protein